jgi:hypothetical protein
MNKIDAAITKIEDTAPLPVIEVKFKDVDSAAFDVKFAGISPAMFAAFASWCTFMSNSGYAERAYAEAMARQASQKIITPTILPGGRH